MQFPPYRLLERDHLAETQAKLERIERLYHVGQEHAWDGRKVLAELLAKHGGIHLPAPKRKAVAEVFALILWGELAAWNVAADLALMLDEPGAKMAATSQAHDEARHFYVMRDYLMELGVEIPPLDGYTQVVLSDLMATEDLGEKLIGMQLIVETVALVIFRSVAKAGIEPVLTDLMPYFERDEARHVGLGVMYLPHVLAKASPLEVARLHWMQLKVATFIGWGTHLRQPSFRELGIDTHAALAYGSRLTLDAMRGLRGSSKKGPAGVLVGGRFLEQMNDFGLRLFFPPAAAELPRWQRSLVGACEGIARGANRILKAAA